MTPTSVPYVGPNGTVALIAADATPGAAATRSSAAGEYCVRLGRGPSDGAKVHRSDEHPVDVDAHALRIDCHQAATEQPRAEKEHETQRCLRRE
jgi:hypothetical protein